MPPICPNQIHLFDKVDLFLNAPGAANQPAVDPDGYIYFHILGMAEQSVQGRATFNVFWDNQRNNRQYFDADLLEQLIAQRIQEHQNACSLLRMVVDRVELIEVRNLQEGLLNDRVDAVPAKGLDEVIATQVSPTLQLQGIRDGSIVPNIDAIPDVVPGMRYRDLYLGSGPALSLTKPFEPSGMVSPQIDVEFGTDITLQEFLAGPTVRAITLHPTGQPGPIPYTDHGLMKDLPKDHPWFAKNGSFQNIDWNDLQTRIPEKFEPGPVTQFIGGHTVVGEISLPGGPTSFEGFKGVDFSNPNLTGAANTAHLTSMLSCLPVDASISDSFATYTGVDAAGQAVSRNDWRPLEPILPGALVHDYGLDIEPISKL